MLPLNYSAIKLLLYKKNRSTTVLSIMISVAVVHAAFFSTFVSPVNVSRPPLTERCVKNTVSITDCTEIYTGSKVGVFLLF